MSRQDTSTTEGLRDIFGYRENHDVVLACAFEECERGNERFDLYDRIGKVVEGLGKRPFLPHREIGLDWVPGKVYSIPNSIVIPTSDVVLAYLGLPSTAAGIMLGSAVQNGIPIIYLFENERDFESLKVRMDTISLGNGIVDIGIVDTRDHTDKLEYESVNIGNGKLEKLEDCLKRFYYYQHDKE